MQFPTATGGVGCDLKLAPDCLKLELRSCFW